MGKGNNQVMRQFYHDDELAKPLDEIFEDLQAYSYELFADDHRTHKHAVGVVLPPLLRDGTLIKGLMYSQSTDYLLHHHPEFSELFNVMAFTGWCNIPWTNHGDGYLVCYDNPVRNAWFRQAYPERADKIIVPLEESDFYIDERARFFPVEPYASNRDIDLLVVSSLIPLKNIPIILEAVKIFSKKYYPIKMTWLGRLNWESEDEEGVWARRVLKEIDAISSKRESYINFHPKIQLAEMRNVYSRSKVFVLGSLIEGKNRSLREAMACDTPVICFRGFNQYVRGDDFAIPPGAGLYCDDFNAEALADRLHVLLSNRGEFSPRQSFLRYYGKARAFNVAIDSFRDYYSSRIPDYKVGNHTNNAWLNERISAQYGIDLLSYVYYIKNSRFKKTNFGMEDNLKALQYYRSRNA